MLLGDADNNLFVPVLQNLLLELVGRLEVVVKAAIGDPSASAIRLTLRPFGPSATSHSSAFLHQSALFKERLVCTPLAGVFFSPEPLVEVRLPVTIGTGSIGLNLESYVKP